MLEVDSKGCEVPAIYENRTNKQINKYIGLHTCTQMNDLLRPLFHSFVSSELHSALSFRVWHYSVVCSTVCCVWEVLCGPILYFDCFTC